MLECRSWDVRQGCEECVEFSERLNGVRVRVRHCGNNALQCCHRAKKICSQRPLGDSSKLPLSCFETSLLEFGLAARGTVPR